MLMDPQYLPTDALPQFFGRLLHGCARVAVARYASETPSHRTAGALSNCCLREGRNQWLPPGSSDGTPTSCPISVVERAIAASELSRKPFCDAAPW
jgi:hypothetical protein